MPNAPQPAAFATARAHSLFTMSDIRSERAQGAGFATKLFDPDDPATSAAFGRGGWWSWTGSNRRPHACKARALPTELQPRRRCSSGRGEASQGRRAAAPRGAGSLRRRMSPPAFEAPRTMVGLGRLERPTSPLSGVRSNHLSYRPVASIPPACPDDEKEKRRRRVPPNGL